MIDIELIKKKLETASLRSCHQCGKKFKPKEPYHKWCNECAFDNCVVHGYYNGLFSNRPDEPDYDYYHLEEWMIF